MTILNSLLKMIIVRDKLLIEFENYSQYHSNRKVLLHMTILFVAGTVAAYSLVMKHVLNNVARPHTR